MWPFKMINFELGILMIIWILNKTKQPFWCSVFRSPLYNASVEWIIKWTRLALGSEFPDLSVIQTTSVDSMIICLKKVKLETYTSTSVAFLASVFCASFDSIVSIFVVVLSSFTLYVEFSFISVFTVCVSLSEIWLFRPVLNSSMSCKENGPKSWS